MNAYEAHKTASKKQLKRNDDNSIAELLINKRQLKDALDKIEYYANLGYYNCNWNLYHSYYKEEIRDLILDKISCRLQTMGYNVSLSEPYLSHGRSLLISW